MHALGTVVDLLELMRGALLRDGLEEPGGEMQRAIVALEEVGAEIKVRLLQAKAQGAREGQEA